MPFLLLTVIPSNEGITILVLQLPVDVLLQDTGPHREMRTAMCGGVTRVHETLFTPFTHSRSPVGRAQNSELRRRWRWCVVPILVRLNTCAQMHFAN